MAKAICQPKKERTTSVDHPVKVTSLCYLKEALIQEKYEDCRSIVDIAREFGAESSEIKKIINSI